MKDLIQIAGVIDRDEARLLMKSGVDYLGFPLRLPINQEDLTEREAAEVIQIIAPPHQAVLITYLNLAVEVVEFCAQLNVNVVQLHGKISREELAKIRALHPRLTLIKSLVVAPNNFAELESVVETVSPWVDAFITDTFDPVTGAEGATGKAHDWRISRRLVELSPRPVFIAGGLNPTNVRRAILEIRPAGVDAHTGVEGRNGRKDPELIRRFVEESRKGFDQIR